MGFVETEGINYEMIRMRVQAPMSNRISRAVLVAMLLLGSITARGADNFPLTAKPEVVGAWKDMRFGMFLCWGPVSLTGKEIGW